MAYLFQSIVSFSVNHRTVRLPKLYFRIGIFYISERVGLMADLLRFTCHRDKTDWGDLGLLDRRR